MYTVSAYYLAFATRAVMMTWFYPVLLSAASFWFFQFEAHSFTDYLNYMGGLAMTGYSGAFMGYLIGAIFDNAEVALGIGNLFAMIAGFGAGLFANTGAGANWFIRFLSWISPLRYGCEIIFRQVTTGRPGQDQILLIFGYTYGDLICYLSLLAFILATFGGGWLILYCKHRK